MTYITPEAMEYADKAYNGGTLTRAERREIERCVLAIAAACKNGEHVSVGEWAWGMYSAKYIGR